VEGVKIARKIERLVLHAALLISCRMLIVWSRMALEQVPSAHNASWGRIADKTKLKRMYVTQSNITLLLTVIAPQAS
jgi:hypothetical protein